MKTKLHRPARFLLPAAFIIAGGVGGYLYYRFIGCATGSCAITSNPYISAVYGGVMGLFLGVALSPDKRGQIEKPPMAGQKE